MFSLTSTSENTLLRIHFEASESKQVESSYWFDESQLDVLNMRGQLEPHLDWLARPSQEGRVLYNAICGFVPATRNLVGQLDCRTIVGQLQNYVASLCVISIIY